MAKKNLPKLGSLESIEAFQGAITLDREAGFGGFVAELKLMYEEQEPKPTDALEQQFRQNLIHQVVNLAFQNS